jgi:uncharacterized membrane protein/mono/diheme cytochrome c family protein
MNGALHNVWLFAGRLHPLVVHFPIAFLLGGAAIEFVRRRGRGNVPARASVVCLCVGGLSAALAAVLGWSDALTAGHQGSDAWVLGWHRWLGVLTACVGAGAAVLATLASRGAADQRAAEHHGRGLFACYRVMVLAGALLVGATGHFGGMLIYGADYLQESWAKIRSASPGGSTELVAAGASVDFVRDVQPIFARRCYQCHAGEKVEGQLHLDSREGALKGGKSGHPALAPGKPGASQLVRLIKGEDPKRAMPPKGGSLDAAQIATLEAWIAQGARWDLGTPGESWHWAYRAPVRVNPPGVRDADWARNPIDQFILARLEHEGLSPSAPADKPTLLRRVSLDLTGLPPTPAELDAFLADTSALAYERVVDRLLASPHHGEKMAMKWLDLARYADTHGYEKDQRRTMWPYRDWVIDAFNQDMPYDRFTVEQLAGDLLPGAGVEELVATGFNRNTQINEEGGVDPEEFRIDAVIDRTNTVGTVWLGTTIGCAQCHNHKNDPISQEEYYRFLAYFNNDVGDVVTVGPSEVRAAGGMIPISTREHRDELARVQSDIGSLQGSLAHVDTDALAAQQRAWEDGRAKVGVTWTPVRVLNASSSGGATLSVGEDGSVVASGNSPESDSYTVEIETDLPRITGIRLELLPDDTTPDKGVGRSPHANIVLTSFRAANLKEGAPPAPVQLLQALADFEQVRGEAPGGLWAVEDSLRADGKSGWAIKPQEHRAHAAIFRLRRPVQRSDGAAAVRLRVVLGQEYGNKHTIGRFRVAATSDEQPLSAKPISQDIDAILSVAPADRTAEQGERLGTYFRSIAPSLASQRDQLGELRARERELIVANAMVMKKADAPRETHVFERGSFLSPGKAVDAGVPTVLTPVARPGGAKQAPRDRLELARWLASSENTLAARVEVNRLWEQHFGRGLVETSEDFGTQGELPTHLELLDWLATEFVRQGWSMKAMHRLIVTSTTYRQASVLADPRAVEKDPSNKLLSRMPRLRVEAETVRDIALCAGGLMSPKIGGPSVFPPQPPGIWTMIYSNDTWVESKGEDRYRRGLYTFARRTAPYPSMTAFDSTSREVLCTRRARTNTPLQALTTLNDPQFVEAAAGVAARMLREGGRTDAERVAYGFVLCVGRRPGEAEAAKLIELVGAERAEFSKNDDAARKLLAQAPGIAREGLTERELAAWSVAGNVLLNLDEAITRE